MSDAPPPQHGFRPRNHMPMDRGGGVPQGCGPPDVTTGGLAPERPGRLTRPRDLPELDSWGHAWTPDYHGRERVRSSSPKHIFDISRLGHDIAQPALIG